MGQLDHLMGIPAMLCSPLAVRRMQVSDPQQAHETGYTIIEYSSHSKFKGNSGWLLAFTHDPKHLGMSVPDLLHYTSYGIYPVSEEIQ